MWESVLLVLIFGFFAGQLAQRLKLPALVGMMLAGVLLGPQVGNILSLEILESADSLRVFAITVILMKAGLGLDREKLKQQGSVSLRLGFLPGICEALAIALASVFLFQFDFKTGLLLGCIIGAESPAVIVPGMLRLKSLGFGVKKGIPDAILTGSALSDVCLLLIFSLVLVFLTQESPAGFQLPGGFLLSPLQALPLQFALQITLGLVLGALAAWILASPITKLRWTHSVVQNTLVAAGLALTLVVVSADFPIFSGYLAVMAMGFFLIEFGAPLARQIRKGFDSLWTVAEIFLFVLLGASLDLSVLYDAVLPGIALLIVGTLIGRALGWYLSTLGSNWNWRERLFLLPGNSAKATVQAAIGALPMTYGLPGGELIFALSAFSILITAPVGAWAIPYFGPKLLDRGIVDATKVGPSGAIRILAAVDGSKNADAVLKKAAELARRSDVHVTVLHVLQSEDASQPRLLKEKAQGFLSDIHYEFITAEGVIEEEIIQASENLNAAEIVIGKRGHQLWETLRMGSVSRAVLEQSRIPVVTVEGVREEL